MIPGDDDDAPLVGCVAIEVVGDVALLRMLAVAPERRGEGLGYVLVEAATERARAQGVRQLYLVTDGAQGYFGEKLGFQVIDRKDVARRDRRRPPSTRWRARRTRPGCARSSDADDAAGPSRGDPRARGSRARARPRSPARPGRS